MATTLTLGGAVDTLIVRLFRDGRFYSEIAPDMALPDGSVVRLLFTDAETEWQAEVADGIGVFNEAPATVNARTHGEAVELRVDEDVWAAGRVRLDGR